VAVTTLRRGGEPIDEYATRFGIRSLRFDPARGLFVNGERVYLQGVNQHHDLGALGAAFNTRAAKRGPTTSCRPRANLERCRRRSIATSCAPTG
jgi:hypothetical protein